MNPKHTVTLDKFKNLMDSISLMHEGASINKKAKIPKELLYDIIITEKILTELRGTPISCYLSKKEIELSGADPHDDAFEIVSDGEITLMRAIVDIFGDEGRIMDNILNEIFEGDLRDHFIRYPE